MRNATGLPCHPGFKARVPQLEQMEILSFHGFELKEEGVWEVVGKVRVLKLGMLCL